MLHMTYVDVGVKPGSTLTLPRLPLEQSLLPHGRAITPFLVLACGLHALLLALPVNKPQRGGEIASNNLLQASLPAARRPVANTVVAPNALPAIPAKTEKKLLSVSRPADAMTPAVPAVALGGQANSTPVAVETVSGEGAMAAPAIVSKAPVLSAPRFDAAYLNNPSPAYPALSRRQNETGNVLLKVSVSPEGHPLAVDVAQSSHSPRLDEAARVAVSRWRFVPAKLGEQPIAAEVMVPIVFRLDD